MEGITEGKETINLIVQADFKRADITGYPKYLDFQLASVARVPPNFCISGKRLIILVLSATFSQSNLWHYVHVAMNPA